jgi:uncharacterized protein
MNNVDELTVSFDGSKAIHDRHRPRRDGGSSFSRVYETVRTFYQAKAAVTLRITVTPLSIEHLDATLAFLADSFPGIAVRIEPVRGAGRALECFQDLAELAGQVTAAMALNPVLASGGLKLATPYNGEGTMYDNIRAIGCPMLEFANWQVAADGTIACCGATARPNPLLAGRCDFRRNVVPNLTGAIEELQRLYHVNNLPLCNDCFCKYHCAGGCPVYPPADFSRHCNGVREAGVEWLQTKASSSTIPRTQAKTAV